MSASKLLAELGECGVELVVTGDQLRYRPREAVTSLLLNQIREYKPELLKSEQCKRQEATQYSDDLSSPEVRKLKIAGWKPKERCGKPSGRAHRTIFGTRKTWQCIFKAGRELCCERTEANYL